MQVHEIDTSRPREVRRFIRFPFELYRDCPQWVPPLIPDMKLALNRKKYPFYRESDADFFIVESEGQTLGRVAAIENRSYNEFHDDKAAFFYYFDAVNDVQVSRALFDAALDWARARGLETMYGPNGLLRADGHGLLVEGFEHRPAVGIAYNYDYYESLVLDAGFERSHDYLSGYVTADADLPQRFYDIAEKVKARRGYSIRSFKTKRELLALAPILHRIYQEAWVDVWGYFPISEQEIEASIRRISLIADPRLIKVVMKGEEPIGFAISYPDVSAALQRTKGRLWPFGWVQLLLEPRRTEWLTFNGVGILPQYQGVGANTVLYTEVVSLLKNASFRFKYGDYVQVADVNLKSLSDALAMEMELYKRHRVYWREV